MHIDSSVTATPQTNPRGYYLVRSPRSIPLEKGVVGIGWDEMPFCNFKVDELLQQMQATGWKLGRHSNQIRRFKGIKKDDIVVVPLWGTVAIGMALGEELHDPAYVGANGANQQRVRFLTDANGKIILLPRTDLKENLQRRLKIRITVADLRDFADELESAIASLSAGQNHSRAAQVESAQKTLMDTLKDKLLKNIQRGQTGLQSGGIGMEQLVVELLRADNFEANGLAKKHFGSGVYVSTEGWSSTADADIVASKTDSLRTDDFLVQVKHHDGQTDEAGLKQLIVIPGNFQQYDDHQLVFITSGLLSPAVREMADKHDILVKDGPELVEWILDSLPKLSYKTHIALGIINVPQVFV